MKLSVLNIILTIKFVFISVGKCSSKYTLPNTVLKEIGDSRNIVALLQLHNLLQLLVRKQMMTMIGFFFLNKYTK